MAADDPRTAGLDGPIAAPDHHRVIFENDHVRVIETVIRAGDTAPLHTHATPHLTIMSSGSEFIRRDAAGAVLLEVRASADGPGMPRYSWSNGLPAHTLENVGPDDLLATTIELKG
jgi:hypothetical protein